MNSKIALKQLNEIERLSKEIRLAADGWNEDWKCLIATLMSARTMDKTTIPVAEELFKKYPNITSLSKAKIVDIEKIIRPVNFYKNKSRHVLGLANMVVKDYSGKIPIDFEKLVLLPGVGRKTANVFLAEQGKGAIGVDTHVNYISKYLGWTKSDKQEKVESDLKQIFPENLWSKLNWILVRFGQTYRNTRLKNEILDGIKKIK